MNQAGRRVWLAAVLLAVLALAPGCGSRQAHVEHGRPGPVALTPAPGSWLGLAFNSSSGSGAHDLFSAIGAVYDRSGPLEVKAGQTPRTASALARGLAVSLASGMIPDIEIDPGPGPGGCTGDPNASTRCLPASPSDVDAYVNGFVATVTAITAAHPGRLVVFEPMNEPWNWGSPPGSVSGRRVGAEYANVLARLFPRLIRARVDLRAIYVPATGRLKDGTSWITDLYAARPCLAPGPHTCGPIAGWNVHAYGLPDAADDGIHAVWGERREMRSGQGNVIISELGFCARGVNGGSGCEENVPQISGSGPQTGRWMAQALQIALGMRRAGWLKGLIVWDRAGDGWAMQRADGTLTPQGRAFARFARSVGGGVRCDERDGPTRACAAESGDG